MGPWGARATPTRQPEDPVSTPEPEEFDPATDCCEVHGCPMTDPCTLRCHERFLHGQMQPNDAWADAENAAAWRRYWDANPGEEEAMKAACDPQRAFQVDPADPSPTVTP